jgi:hypothetical protein
MPFQLDEWLHDVFTNSTAKKIVENPLISAIIIVILFVIIAHFMFYDSELQGWSWARRLIKFGIYGLAATLPVVYLHYKNTEDDYNKRVYGRAEMDLLRNIEEVKQPDAQVGGGPLQPQTSRTVGRTSVEPEAEPKLEAEPKPALAPIAQVAAAPQVQVVVQAPPRSPPRPILRTPTDNKQ